MQDALVKLVKVITSKDGDTFQKASCGLFGKVQDLKVLNTYGVSYNPPDDSFGVSVNPNGYGKEEFVTIDRPDLRFTGLAKGELKTGNYLTQNYIHYKEDGTIEIYTTTVDVLGNVVITGTSGATDHFSGTVSGLTHTHSGVVAGGGVSGPPIGGGGGPAIVLAIVDGGTGESTAQDAIDALTQVAGATVGYVLTKDSGGNAVWEAASGAGEVNTASNVGTDGLGVFKQKIKPKD